MLQGCYEHYDSTDQDKAGADDCGSGYRWMFAARVAKDGEEKPEARDDKSQADDGNSSAYPCQQSSLRCEVNPWIVA